MLNVLNVINRFMKKRYLALVLILPILFGAFGELYNVFVISRQKCMIIDFNYPGSEQGLNPDGSMFDISDLKSDEVLKNAIAGMDEHNYDIDTLRSRLFISSKISSNTLDSVISNVQNGNTTTYMPTTFYIYYSQKNRLSKNESDIFMDNLAAAYEEYFNEKYSEKNDILIYTDGTFDFDDKDYTEIYRMFYDKVDSMISYVKTHYSENRAFYTEDGSRLGTASKKLENFRDVNLEDFNAFIIQNAVSKNNAEYIKRLQYILENKQLDYEKERDSSDISKKALSIYDPSIAAVAFVPSIDSDNSYYMSRTKTGIDDLTRNSYNDGMEAAKTQGEIDEYKNEYDKFSSVEVTSADNIAAAENMVAALSAELESLSEEVIKIDNEYLDMKTRNYFRIKVPDDYSPINVTLIVKWMILGVMLAVVIIIVAEIFKKKLSEWRHTLKKFFRVMTDMKKNGGKKA